MVFATNVGLRKARAMLANIPGEYRGRRGIETGYRVAKQVRPFTSSGADPARRRPISDAHFSGGRPEGA